MGTVICEIKRFQIVVIQRSQNSMLANSTVCYNKAVVLVKSIKVLATKRLLLELHNMDIGYCDPEQLSS